MFIYVHCTLRWVYYPVAALLRHKSAYDRRDTSFLYTAYCKDLNTAAKLAQDQGLLVALVLAWNRQLHIFREVACFLVVVCVRDPLDSQTLTSALLFPKYQSIRMTNTMNEALDPISLLRNQCLFELSH
jgi:hypothetical protein